MEKNGTDRRLEILEAAMTLFSQKGFERTTVDEIASSANVGKGTVYLYFDNKEQIFLAIIDKGLQELTELLMNISHIQDFWQQIHKIVYTNLEYVEKHHEFYRLFLKERLSMKLLNPEQTHQMIMEKHNMLHRLLTEFMQKGIDQGYLRPGNPNDYCIAVGGILNHFAIYWIMVDSTESLTAKTDVILELMLSGIKKCS